jgi:hypothetical protein
LPTDDAKALLNRLANEDFVLFSYSPLAFFHIRRTTGKQWQSYKYVCNRVSRYKLTLEANVRKLEKMPVGNGLPQRELQGINKKTKDTLQYWHFARKVMKAAKQGIITENDLNQLNEQAKEQLREHNYINIQKLEQWVNESLSEVQ